MPFLKTLIIKNFKCFRRETTIDLEQSTYLIGPNNAGKTAILAAIRCFFDSSVFSGELLNRSEVAAKQEGSNRADITIEFDLSVVRPKSRRERLVSTYGETLKVRKAFLFRENTATTFVSYHIDGEEFAFMDALPGDVQKILRAVSVSYIHPQEGADLLRKAQEKFKERLFNNWGRGGHSAISGQLLELQSKWESLRKAANSYLSSSLTENLRAIWPESSTMVDLPARIEEIVAVSKISFKSSPGLPEINLTEQGTGAQSIILYQTHYILDSDLSLHRGFYVPVWLLEEPESFLHADVTIKLAHLLASKEWTKSIQMVISTHSPMILASTKNNAEKSRWVVMNSHALADQKKVSDVLDSDIENIGRMMGDPNFDAYFQAADDGNLFFIEDVRPLTKTKFDEVGLRVAKALDGTSNLKKYVDVFRTVPNVVAGKAFFLLDNDKGTKDFGSLLTASSLKLSDSNFSIYEVGVRVYIILMPPSFAVEDLFSEFEDELEELVHQIYQDDFSFQEQIPLNLTRAVAAVRSKSKPANLEAAKLLIKNEQDVKDSFWKKISSDGYRINNVYVNAIENLMDHV